MTQPTPDRLFATLDATWPAARYQSVGPWTLREGLGGGQRVSAATAKADIDDNDITAAEAGMRALNQRPLFMIRESDAELDGWLAARGYEVVDPVTMYIATAKSLSGTLPLTAAMPSWPPLAIQREIWTEAGIGPARMAIMDRVTVTKTAFLGRVGDSPGGTTFVAADGDVAMLHALEVARAERRKGIGRNLLTGAANWAIRQGAEWLALAVVTANAPANTLYREAGMMPAAHYHYRRAPEGSA